MKEMQLFYVPILSTCDPEKPQYGIIRFINDNFDEQIIYEQHLKYTNDDFFGFGTHMAIFLSKRFSHLIDAVNAANSVFSKNLDNVVIHILYWDQTLNEYVRYGQVVYPLVTKRTQGDRLSHPKTYVPYGYNRHLSVFESD